MAAASVLRPSVVLCILCGLLLPALSLAEYTTCPVNCKCVGDIVDCSKSDLTSVPKDLPTWTIILTLANNKITSLEDDAFPTLDKLEEIDLSQNELTSLNGSVFAKLTKLKKIKLAYNQLTSFPDFAASFPSITELVLNHNSIDSLPPAALDNLPNLRLLNVNYNQITTIRNDTFNLHPHLHQLYLSNNRIRSVARNAFANLTNLKWLKLTKNKIRQLPDDSFSKLGRLVMLELSKNELRTIKGLMFKGLGNLQTLHLKRNHISTLMDGAFFGLNAITNLHLDHNNISAVTKGWMFGLDSLQILSLSQNSVDDIGDEAWDKSRHLTELDLSQNKLGSIGVSTFMGLASLKVLSLDNNRIKIIADEAFAQLDSLDRLFLNHNELSWTLEELTGAFSGLHSLTRLGLAHNHVRSLAVGAFQSLTALRQLHLEDNPLTVIHRDAFPASLTALRLNSSAFLCDCQLAWLGEWLRSKAFGEEEDVSARCAYPQHLSGANVIDVPADKFECVSIPKPVLVRQPKKQIALKGSNLTLVCEAASSQADMTPVWKRDNEVLSGSGPDGTISNVESEPEEGSGTVTLITTLHIDRVADRHRGKYQCVISNTLGTAYSTKAEISVHVFPTFLRTPSDVTVRAGSEAVLACAAEGEPKPEIVWQKVGGDDFPAARERRMGVAPPDMYSIENVKSQDQGVYSCMATNAAGTIVANATLQVLEVPHFLDEAGMKDEEVHMGQTAVIECRVAGNPLPKITWFKDGEPLATHDSPLPSERHFLTGDDQLLVVVETKASDAGEYECLATNTLGETRSFSYLVVRGGKRGEAHTGGGGMDKSTTTGIIIIAVVCCIVGTSLVWVIIIYQTRKRRAGDDADRDASPPGMINPGPYHQSYSEVVPVGGRFSGLFGGESQTVPLTGEDDDATRQHNGWPRHSHRRHSDSASSHSTQSTRSTGLLSTFHPGTLNPHHSTLLLTYDTANASPAAYMEQQRGEAGYSEQPHEQRGDEQYTEQQRGEGGYSEQPHEQRGDEQYTEQQRGEGGYSEQPHEQTGEGRYTEQPLSQRGDLTEQPHSPRRGEITLTQQSVDIHNRGGQYIEQPPQESDRLLESNKEQVCSEQTVQRGEETPFLEDHRDNVASNIAIVHAIQHPPPPDEENTPTFPASSQATQGGPASPSHVASPHPPSSPTPTPTPAPSDSEGALEVVTCDTQQPTTTDSDVMIVCDKNSSKSPQKTKWLPNGAIANGGHRIPNGLHEPPTGVSVMS